jgi:hypothetical protein
MSNPAPYNWSCNNISTPTAQKTPFLCWSRIVALERILFAEPLLSNGCCIVAYFAVVAYQQIYMPQCRGCIYSGDTGFEYWSGYRIILLKFFRAFSTIRRIHGNFTFLISSYFILLSTNPKINKQRDSYNTVRQISKICQIYVQQS